jgi:hypothetical protein
LRLRRSTSQPASMTAVHKPRTKTSGCGFIVLSVDLVEPARAGIECAAIPRRGIPLAPRSRANSLYMRGAPRDFTRRAAPENASIV